MKEESKKVVITHLDVSKNREEVFAIAKRSRLLINSICQYSKDLKKKDIIVHERYVNIIRTDIGYFCAFYEDDLIEQRTEPKNEQIQKQFEGMDGRMKVILHNSEGAEVVKDVAEMMAMAFIPNPENYEFVKHKDGDVKNNIVDNLYWSKFK